MDFSRTTKVYRKKPINFHVSDNYLFEKEWEKEIVQNETVSYSNVTILPNLVVLQKNKIITEIITRSNYKKTFKNYIKRVKLKTIKINQSIWLTDLWSNNYFHWFTDTFPRLLLAEKHYPDIPIIIPAYFNQYPYITESLKVFPKTKILWLRNYQKFRIKELIYIAHTAPTGNYNETLIKEVSNKLREKFELNKISANSKTIISRQSAPNRKIINCNQLVKPLNKNNINNIIFENKTWIEQIRIAANTNMLIGTHGAGLTNMLFMPPKSKVLELRRKDDTQNNCYFSLASALNIDYSYQLCEVDDYSKTTQENDFYVDINKFEKNINSLIAESF